MGTALPKLDTVQARALFSVSAGLSNPGYDDAKKIKSFREYLHLAPNQSPTFIKGYSGAIEAAVVFDGKRTIVVFPPMSNEADREAGTDHALVQGPEKGKGKVHQGFWNRLMETVAGKPSLWEQIKAEVGKHGSSPVIYTGFSMGGAIATLAAAQHVNEFGPKRIESVISFGQPKVGDGQFAAEYQAKLKDKHFRVITRDLVPMLPTEDEFKPVGNPYYIREYGNRETTVYFLETNPKVIAALEVDLKAMLGTKLNRLDPVTQKIVPGEMTYGDIAASCLYGKKLNWDGIAPESRSKLLSVALAHGKYHAVDDVVTDRSVLVVTDGLSGGVMTDVKFLDGLPDAQPAHAANHAQPLRPAPVPPVPTNGAPASAPTK